MPGATRLVFLCGSLEPGRDGVGDYTRTLARECLRAGSPSAIIALNDRHFSGEATVSTAADGLAELRLSAAAPWTDRIERAARFIAERDPEWISLQFVAYGFHAKGIPIALAARLRQLAGSRRLHVMAHELWSAGGLRPTAKSVLLGRVQRFFVLRLLRSLRPSVLHVSLPVNVELLAAAGIRAAVLPLFGNIPIAERPAPDALVAQVRGEGQAWVGGFFGALYPQWQPEPLLGVLQRAARARGQTLRLVSAGRLGAEDQQRWNALRRAYSPAIDFVTLGAQPAETLSQIFQLLDFGLPTASWRVLGKSGATAALLDHGLPIIVVPDPGTGFRYNAVTCGDPRLIHRCDELLEAKLTSGLLKHPPGASAPRIAAGLLAQLRNAPC